MIHEAYMPVYMGSRFLARDGRTEVVQEALADLKRVDRAPVSVSEWLLVSFVLILRRAP